MVQGRVHGVRAVRDGGLVEELRLEELPVVLGHRVHRRGAGDVAREFGARQRADRRRAERLRDLAERVRRVDVPRRRAEVRPVQDVEQLGAQLRVARAADREPLRQRHVDALVAVGVDHLGDGGALEQLQTLLGGDLLGSIGLPEWLVLTFSIARWFLLAIVMSVGLAVIYRYAPDRQKTRWQWVSWGAIIATLLWLVATAVLFIYIQNFANFSQSYSLFAGIIVLMMWLNYTGLIVLVGAEVNHQLEKRTVIPTTK